jgi:hypothetical protein
MRIIVTGSREWTDKRAIRDAILNTLHRMNTGFGPHTLVHGDCPTGADVLADEVWWETFPTTPIPPEIHRANWKLNGRAAGPIRNQQMIDQGADVCIAFPLGDSRGTRDCIRRAEAAGIPVLNFGDQIQ